VASDPPCIANETNTIGPASRTEKKNEEKRGIIGSEDVYESVESCIGISNPAYC
jgi:hypothetical protein